MTHFLHSKYEIMSYAWGSSDVGYVLVVASGKGVIAVMMADSKDVLVPRMIEYFPFSESVEGGAEVEGYLAAVLAYLKKPSVGLHLPLDLRGTVFQKKVWAEVQKLPVNEVITYKDVARNIGQPSAARAVGSACAGGLLAVVIPFHRVLNSKGEIHKSTQWSEMYKRKLINREMQVKI